MDDLFPCRKSKYSNKYAPVFTRGNGAELWVIILEKAWAKIYNSYDNIEGGLTRECLHDLTGAPTKTLWVSHHKDEIWENILRGE